MIKFFRKIRQNLLSEGKTVKYFKYAIGEIILVVIGILVALSVNNKNESRKEKIEEEKILVGIKNDFIETRRRLFRTMYKQKETVDNSVRLINLLELEGSLIRTDSIGSFLTHGALSYYRVEPVIGTYDALIGSGNTSLIQNQDLLTALAKFSAVSKLPFEDEVASMNLRKLMNESIGEYSYILHSHGNRGFIGANYKYSEQDKQVAIKKLRNNKPFLSYLLLRTSSEKSRLSRQESLLELADEVLVSFDVKSICLSAEELQKYTGTYELTEDMSIPNKDDFKNVIFVKENQLYVFTFGYNLALIPDEQDSYYVRSTKAMVKFEMKNDTAIGFSYFQGDSPELKFKKTSIK